MLKQALSDPKQVLAYPDFSESASPFIIETDTCKLSEGANLFQEQNGIKRVMAYASRASEIRASMGIPQQESHCIWWAVTEQFSYHVRATSKPVKSQVNVCIAGLWNFKNIVWKSFTLVVPSTLMPMLSLDLVILRIIMSVPISLMKHLNQPRKDCFSIYYFRY